MFTKKQMLEIHAIAKTLQGDYSARLKMAFKIQKENSSMITSMEQLENLIKEFEIKTLNDTKRALEKMYTLYLKFETLKTESEKNEFLKYSNLKIENVNEFNTRSKENAIDYMSKKHTKQAVKKLVVLFGTLQGDIKKVSLRLDFTGTIITNKYRYEFDTILAGGYNIQCLHNRNLVNIYDIKTNQRITKAKEDKKENTLNTVEIRHIEKLRKGQTTQIKNEKQYTNVINALTSEEKSKLQTLKTFGSVILKFKK